MTRGKKSSDIRHIELEKLLKQAREETAYYQRLAIDSGKRTIREINQLSQLFSEHKKVEEKLIRKNWELNLFINSIQDMAWFKALI